jgi:Bacterial membrane protein YfhO
MKFDSGAVPSQSVSTQPARSRRILEVAFITLALIGLWVFIYQHFIFGDGTLLYKDVGVDSINIYYPRYVLVSNYIHHGGVPSWSFHVGMGQNVFSFLSALLITPVVWLCKGAIARGLVYQHLLYVIVSGLLFSRFLMDRGLAFAACLLGGLLLSFSGYMCMGSCWYFHASEVVCFTFILFAAERAISRGRWIYLVPAVTIVGLLGAFHLYLAALLLFLYVPARLVERFSWRPLPVLRTSALLAAAAVLGVGLGAILTVNSFHAVLNSPRGSGQTSLAGQLFSKPIFSLGSSLYYITAVLRPFGNDLIGTGDDFRGWQNYLEAPMSYCGLLCLVIFPQIFVASTLRNRILYGLFLSAVLLTTIFPWFRYSFWAFQGDYYRTVSLFAVFGFITLGMTAFSRYIESSHLNLWVLGGTITLLMGILYFPLQEIQSLINHSLRLGATIFLFGYVTLLVAGRLLRRSQIVAWIVIVLAVIELVYFDRVTVVNRPVVTNTELTERIGYNDETVDVVKDLNANDKGFFRIRKTWGSGPGSHESLNDAMVFGYYGTSSYSSFNDINYIKFLIAAGAMSEFDLATDTLWTYGLVDYPLLSTFACEKYVLTNNPVPFETGDYYEFARRYGDKYLFRNQLFLPLGLSFEYYITEDVFSQLPQWAKPVALLNAVVLSDETAAAEPGPSRLNLDDIKYQVIETPLPDIAAKRRSTALNVRSFRETRIDGTIHLNQKGVLVLQTPFDPGWRAFQDGRQAQVLKADVGLLGVVLDSGEHTVELRYRPPFLFFGAAVSFLSLLIFAATLWRWPHLSLSC